MDKKSRPDPFAGFAKSAIQMAADIEKRMVEVGKVFANPKPRKDGK